MGKRSNFARNPRDFYRTPEAAVYPLIPHLPQGAAYWEPCAGDGALCVALDRGSDSRLILTEALDIEPRHKSVAKADALASIAPINANVIITNPPWSRPILHQMIEHFSAMLPTWLLFDADWAHTKQAAPYLPRLRKIVAVGRLKWIEGSPHTGKDNCAWHLFTGPSDTPPAFFGRAS